MKRTHAAPPLVPLEGAAHMAARSHAFAQNLQKDHGDEKSSWYKVVVNSWDEDEDENSSVVTDEDQDANSADVYIYAEIGGWFGIWADEFIDVISKLDVETINLHINSPGGSIFDGVAIYNALVSHKARIVVSVDSLAASAASFIAQAGDEIIMRRASTMMIHDGSMGVYGDAAYLRQNAEILDKLSNNIASIYAYRAGGTVEEWRATMIGEAWYTAEEAVEAGLADNVEGDGKSPEDNWDLSAFNHAGRAAAPSAALIRQNVLNRLHQEKKMTAPTEDTPAVEPETTPAVEPETTEPPTTEPVAPDAEPVPADPEVPADRAPVARAQFSVMVNGVATSDLDSIQKHINALEGFATESRNSGRKEYVASLARDGKIGGPQVASLEKVVLAMNDEAFADFKAAYDTAPKLPLFARHGAQASVSETTANKARSDRMEVLNEIIEHLKNGGKTQAQLEATDAWQELQTLQAQVEAESQS